MRLRSSCRVTANHDSSALGHHQTLEQRHGEACCLVGHDAPAQAARLDFGEHVLRLGEKPRLHAERAFVVGEKRVAQRFEIRILSRHAEGRAQHAPRTMRGMRAQRVERKGR